MKPAVAAIGGVVASVVVALGIAAFVLDDDGADRGAGDRDAATGTAPPTTAAVDRGGDVIVFLRREVTDAQRQSIEALLDTQPEIASYEYWDQERSTAEAREILREDSEMSARIDQGVWVPTSYRLRLSTCDPATFSRIVGDAETWPGVYEATPMQSLLDRCNQPAQPAHAGRT